MGRSENDEEVELRAVRRGVVADFLREGGSNTPLLLLLLSGEAFSPFLPGVCANEMDFRPPPALGVCERLILAEDVDIRTLLL